MEKGNIGIITHYGVHNHGAQLQLFALLLILREKGFSVHALQFEKDYRYMERNAKNKYSISLKSIPVYVKYLFVNGLRKTAFNVQKKKIFDKFREVNDILGEQYEDFVGELAIVGSDEVFSFETGVTGAFWGVGSKAKKLISYAASFGSSSLQEIRDKKLDSFVVNGIKRFSALSVRDNNSAEIIKALSGVMSVKNCDPVIFYSYRKEIEEYARLVKINEPYILLYSYDNNMNFAEDIALVRTVAETKKLPVYSVGFYHKWCDKNINASPLELLGWFKNAEYIITDTFHGTVLSLITHSQFATKLRGNGNKLCNLLSEYDLENRIFTTADECLSILDTIVNYDAVENKMSHYRMESESYFSTIFTDEGIIYE